MEGYEVSTMEEAILKAKPTELDKKYADIPDMKHSEGCDYCHNFFNEGENSSLIKESLYLNSHKIADVDVCIDLDRLVLRSDEIEFGWHDEKDKIVIHIKYEERDDI